jgi:lambda repressor-like predicted transcriptional regulator
MSVEMLDRVYGHHHPDHLRTAANFIGYRPRENWPFRWPERDRPRDAPRNPLKSLVGPVGLEPATRPL